METWAHGLDVHAALGAAPQDTDRLAAVAWLATRALPYAYTVAGREPPSEALRVELTLPSGATWSFGPDDAPDQDHGSRGSVLPGVRATAAARPTPSTSEPSATPRSRRSRSPARISDRPRLTLKGRVSGGMTVGRHPRGGECRP